MDQECDIVMKGGITSGVVYPAAVVELSKTYVFKNIGGTSAGAIAAAISAAAEYARRTGVPNAFAGLAGLPKWLSTNNHLSKLFKPNAKTRPLFLFFMAFLDAPKGSNKLFIALKACYSAYLGWAFAYFAVGLILAGLALSTAYASYWAAALVVGFLGPLVSGAIGLYSVAAVEVPKNFYGMCSGMADGDLQSNTVLTSWLAGFIDNVAGVSGGVKPLTFGDLWTAGAEEVNVARATPKPDRDESVYDRQAERAERSINLEMITTNLTHGRPYRFPFDTNIFYFDPREFEQLFPPKVVAWMCNNARKGSTSDPQEQARINSALPLLPLPEAKDIPIVVSARMSLSFPLLISAIPLYAVDWGRKKNQENKEAPAFERCWFSDGGLSSNFPIHLFDGPIPTRPTFGINLRSFHPDFPEDPKNQANNIWMPTSNAGSVLELWDRFEKDGPSLGGFCASILNAMQNWQDNMQSRVPGFRDRIVHVYLSDEEGGLNLNMDSGILDKLEVRGRFAGARLVTNFTAPDAINCGSGSGQPMNWNNHRIVRYRTAMSLIEYWVRRFCDVYANTPGYSAITQRPIGSPPCTYPFETLTQRAYAVTATNSLVTLNSALQALNQSFADGAPRPQPELVTRPHR